jgi:hypothetical protein
MGTYDINYNDERFQAVEADKQQAMTDLNNTYNGMIEQSDSYYQSQIDASKEWADKQSQLQQEKTDFAIEKIEQQKEQAKKDYTKEQSGAYVDWQKQSDRYGVNAEQMAAQGMTKTGFAESSQVSMYNTYQNRVASARASYDLATLNYNNAIKDAQLQNNSVLAEIAFEAYQKQLELSLQGFQYKNQLLIEQSNKKMELDEIYHNRWQDVLAQINHENALAEQIRQYNEQMALQKAKFEEEKRQYNEQLAIQKQQIEKSENNSGGGGGQKVGKGKTYDPLYGKVKESSTLEKEKTTSKGNFTKATYDSLSALGYSGASGNKIATLEAQGVIEGYVDKNGNYVFRRRFTPGVLLDTPQSTESKKKKSELNRALAKVTLR